MFKHIWRRTTLAACCLLLAAWARAVQPGWTTVEVRTSFPGQIETLAQGGYDIWEMRDGKALIYASPEDVKRLTGDGFTPIAVDVPALHADGKAVDGYPTYDEYVAQMQAWASDYPGFVSLFSLGKTGQGRDVWMLKISDNVGIDEQSERDFLFLGLQHAREWLSGTTLRGIIQYLLDNKDTDPRAQAAVSQMQIFAVLVANPDGYVYTHTTDRLWRKNRRNNGNGTFGVDLNRNWPFQWSGSGADANTSSNLYRGPSVLSEPENSTLDTWVRSRNGRLVGCLNYHSYGNLVMHSWAYTTAVAPGVETFDPIVNNMGAAMHAVNNQTFYPGSWGVALGYTGTGVTDDTFHASYGIPTITCEVRPVTEAQGGFVMPGSAIVPTFNEQLPGCLLFLDWARTNGLDATPPVISNVTVTVVSPSSVQLSWTTDDPCDRLVEYGTTVNPGISYQPDRLRAQAHKITLTGLSGGTRYYARVKAKNLAGLETASHQFSFGTTALAKKEAWVVR